MVGINKIIDMIEVYQSNLGELTVEDAKFVQEDLAQNRQKLETELDKLYESNQMGNSGKISVIESTLDDLNILLSELSTIIKEESEESKMGEIRLLGEEEEDTEKEEVTQLKEEEEAVEEETKIMETEPVFDVSEQTELTESYQEEPIMEKSEVVSREEPEFDERPVFEVSTPEEIKEEKKSYDTFTIKVGRPSVEYIQIAKDVVLRRVPLQETQGVIQDGERTAEMLMKKIFSEKDSFYGSEPTSPSLVYNYDKDERVR